VPFARRAGAWAPVAGGWPRLSAALEALERRRQALESARPAGVTRRRYRALAWYLRSEREAVQVAEDFRVDEDGADRPRDESGSRRFALLVAPDGGFDDRE
jgi:hypothetical protein